MACGARGAESIIAPPTGVPVTVAADNVTINGVKLVAASATRALSAEGRDGLNVRYNVVEQVGAAVSVLPVRAIDVDLLGLPADCTIEWNCIDQTGGGLHVAGATGISVRNTSGLASLAQVSIRNNVINGVTVGATATGEAARGIAIEAGVGMDGVVVQLNTVQGIAGPQAQAIVLTGPTPNADVLNNKVHSVTAAGNAQGTGVLITSNSGAATIEVTGNAFTATAIAIHNQMSAALATATCNWFGTDEPALVRAAHSGPMEVVPWLIDGTETINGAVAPGFQAVGACAGYPVTVTARGLLQGAYDAQSGLMRDNLRANGLLPLAQPYGPFLGYTGNEQVRPEVLAVTGPDAVVDWVVLEVRSAATPNVVAGRRAALLQRDGDIVDLDGVSPVRIWQAPRGIHHIALRHRNHLGTMTQAPQYYGGAQVGAVDLVTGAAFGTNARRSLATGVSGLWSGNTSGDGALKYSGPNNDRDPVLVALPSPSANAVLANVYHRADINLDGLVKYTGAANDRDPILQNIGGTTPTAVRVQQLP